MDDTQLISDIRAFTRFYTPLIGALDAGHLKTPYSLAEARVIYELAHHEQTTASALGDELGLDAGYLSRMLASFQKRGLIEKQPSPTDGRQQLIALTHDGQEAFAKLNSASQQEIGAMLQQLSADDQRRLMEAIQTIERMLGATPEHKVPYILRPPQPGDLGWVVQAHGELYAEEFGWDAGFEALVARIVADYAETHDPEREAAWIAEDDQGRVGCVFCVREDDETARLRILVVDPRARGHRLGARLVDECLTFAREAGYRRMVLWTNHPLVAARKIYLAAGFELVAEEPHHSYGVDLVGQTYARDL